MNHLTGPQSPNQVFGIHKPKISKAFPGECSKKAISVRFFHNENGMLEHMGKNKRMQMKLNIAYRARFIQVLTFIDDHLDGDLELGRLAAIAACSKFHFHRQFSQLFGVRVGHYVQILRMKRAVYQLAFRQTPIIEIALEAGYGGPESFARRFKALVGHTPREFRSLPAWSRWRHHYQPTQTIRSLHLSMHEPLANIKLVEFPATQVAAMEHHGHPEEINTSIRNFIAWRRATGNIPNKSKTFNILYNNPEDTPAHEFRHDLCATTREPIEPNDFGMIQKTIPAGRCAKVRYIGSEEGFSAALKALYVEWLPSSGQELGDFPLFCERISFFPNVPENQAVTDIYLPLKA